jgi:DNA repair protein RadA/Sms
MAKPKNIYQCSVCEAEFSKWIGRCSSCGAWNTVHEVLQTSISKPIKQNALEFPQKICDIQFLQEDRIYLPDDELNRVLGGGLVKGSLVLLGGEPGIGKSTLALQLALSFENDLQVLYVSGEESEKQIKFRAERLFATNTDVYIYPETILENILRIAESMLPDIIIIDSIQTIYYSEMESAPGSVSQVRECTQKILKFAKSKEIPVIIIGHVTKEGFLAGPKTLEHMVDTVISFEGDRHLNYRMLRCTKNRFGSTLELGIYEMTSHGLISVPNPSELFLNQSDEKLSGVAIGTSLEGNRVLLLECQALITDATFGNPQRASTGLDSKRMNLILAVLEKKARLKLGTKDVFINVTGGLKVEDPALDLAFAAAIASSYFEVPLNRKIAFIGEIGLTGEIRSATRLEQRINEAEKLGFQKIVLSKYAQKEDWLPNTSMELLFFEKLEEIIQYFC